MAFIDIREIIQENGTEYFLDREGIDYKVTFGASGEQLNIKECPWCSDSRYKVYINSETGLGNCFHCDQKFNFFALMKEFLGYTNSDTFAYFESAQGSTLQIQKPKVIQPPTGHLLMPESYEIPIEGRNLKYLEDRGVDSNTAQYFGLRYCHSGSFAYKDQYGRVRQQDYSKRVLIPIYDLGRTFVTFQGRDITGEKENKYLFPPGLASSGRFLYNGHNAKGAKRIVIGEGVFDAIALKQALNKSPDLKDAVPVATFGKHLSATTGCEQDQLSQLYRLRELGLREVIFIWDGSKDAIAASAKAAELVRQMGLAVKVATLPDGKDPNEVAPEIVCETIRQARVATTENLVRLKLLGR